MIKLTTDMQAAFEVKYQRDWSDPAGDDIKAVWADAWEAASGHTGLDIQRIAILSAARERAVGGALLVSEVEAIIARRSN